MLPSRKSSTAPGRTRLRHRSELGLNQPSLRGAKRRSNPGGCPAAGLLRFARNDGSTLSSRREIAVEPVAQGERDARIGVDEHEMRDAVEEMQLHRRLGPPR